jgi:hypothetical protein
MAKLVMVFDEKNIDPDRIRGVADSIFTINKNKDGFFIEKHRYLACGQEGIPFPIKHLTEAILIDKYQYEFPSKKDVQDGWLIAEGYLT